MEAAVGQTTTTVVAGDNDGRKDPTNVVKGKRTKRQRPQSPISFTISSNNDTNDRKDVSYNNSPACSSGFPAEEDEETAECLILLSRGESKKNKDDDELYTYKFNSKKYIQTPENATAGKVGVFVYECKTCGRSFPSFQALGGHRASHKKPKNNDDKGRPPPYTVVSGNDDPSPSAMFTSFNKYSSSLKLHECSICGTEFNSGQALGGHMRRHRVAGGNKGGNSNVTGADAGNTNNVALSLIPFNPVTAMEVHDEDDQKSKNDALCLDLGLDLNLPAPVEATGAAGNQYHHERSSAFTPAGENRKKKRPDVHFSAAGTLVDSHY